MDEVVLLRVDTALCRQLLGSAIRLYKQREGDCAAFSASQSVGLEFSALAEQRNLRVRQQLDLADEAVAPSKLARATRTAAISV